MAEQASISILLVGEGQLVREQDALVRDRDHVIVEGPGRDRRLGLLGEQSPRGVKPVQPRNRLRRLDMLPRRESAADHAVNEDLQPRHAVPGGKPHVVGRAFIAERRRNRSVDGKGLPGERDFELSERRRPFMASVRHRPQVRDGQVALAVGGVRRGRYRGGVRGPHRRGRHGGRRKLRLGAFRRRPELRQP